MTMHAHLDLSTEAAALSFLDARKGTDPHLSLGRAIEAAVGVRDRYPDQGGILWSAALDILSEEAFNVLADEDTYGHGYDVTETAADWARVQLAAIGVIL